MTRHLLSLGLVAAILGSWVAPVILEAAAVQEIGLPPPSREVLPNGLRLIIQDHRAADIVALHLFVGVGGRDEARAQLGFSHFQEHMLFKGTDTQGPGFVDRAVEGVGGRSNANTSLDYTFYYLLLPKEETAKGIRLLADMAFRSKFEPEELQREADVILEEGRIVQDNPRTALVRQLYELIFRDHPYGNPLLGTPKTLKGATRDGVYGYYKLHYVPDNMALVVAGPVEAAAVRAAVAETFGRVPTANYRRAPLPPPKPLTGGLQADVERPERQARLALGWVAPRGDDPDSFPVDMLVSILGGTESSRLQRTLRDRERLVSSITASYAALMGGGVVSVRAELEKDDLEKVERRILEEIARLQEQLATEEEREIALTKFEADHAFDTETVEGLAYAYGLAETTWKLEEELRYVKRLGRVTREQIRDAARRYLPRTDYVRVRFVPKSR